MGFSYTVLPDGTIMKISSGEDVAEAVRIARDELGDLHHDSGD